MILPAPSVETLVCAALEEELLAFAEIGMATFATGPGKTLAAAQLSHYLAITPNISRVLIVGTAGSLPNRNHSHAIGSVVSVASCSQLNADGAAVDAMLGYAASAPDLLLTSNSGTCHAITVDRFITDGAELMRSANPWQKDACMVDMETYGMVLAATLQHKNTIALRLITDDTDNESPTAWREALMQSSGTLLKAWEESER